MSVMKRTSGVLPLDIPPHARSPLLPAPREGGFVVVTGDDADDMWHCEESRCGGLYPSLFRAVVFVDATTVKVRADRSHSGDGRVYSLHFEVRDTAGNLTRGVCPVGVPLTRTGAPVVDSGEVWRSCRPAAR